MQGFGEDKLGYLPLALAVPVAIIAVIAATSGGPSLAESKSFSSSEKSAIRRTDGLLADIPQRGAALGDPQAPATLQFFGDLQCPESRQVILGALPFLIRHWVRDGELRIVYRSKKADTPSSSEFIEQHAAALAAGEQGKLWNYIDLFYREQGIEFSGYADDDFLEGIAEQAGLDLRRWREDRESRAWAGKIESDEAMAEATKVGVPPSFLIGRTGGEAHVLRHFSLGEAKVFDEAIRELL